MKLGCRPSQHFEATLKVSSYVPDKILVPDECNWYGGKDVYSVAGNDVHGCCVTSAASHATECWRAWEKKDFADIPVADVIATAEKYGALEGWSIIECLKAWHRDGLFGSKIPAYAAIPLKKHRIIQACIYEFGGINTACHLPEAWMDTWVWTTDAGPIAGGHDVVILGYDHESYFGISWGEVVEITQSALDKYFFELWAVVSPLWTSDKRRESPTGIAIDKLVADARAL